jgi:Dockerin type I domain
MKLYKSICIAALALSMAPVQSLFAEKSNVYLSLDTSEGLSRQQVADVASSLGGQLRHELSEKEYVLWIPPMMISGLADRVSQSYVESDESEHSLSTTSKRGPNYRLWRGFLVQSDVPSTDSDLETTAGLTNLIESEDYCGLESIDASAFSSSPRRSSSDIAAIGPIHTTYSSYMIGSVAVAMFLMESTGSESVLDWTTQEEDNAICQAMLAFDKLSDKAYGMDIDVNWVYEIYRGTPTTSEPIKPLFEGFDIFGDSILTDWTFPHQSITGWDFGWINDALAHFGSVGTEWDGLFNQAATLRSRNKTDFGFGLYIVKNELFEAFPGNAAGYTKSVKDLFTGPWIRGPFAVSKYTFGPSFTNTNFLIMHEVSHVFGAMDEYHEPSLGLIPDQCKNAGSCTEVGGYLRFPNQNCKACLPHVSCNMGRFATSWPNQCPYTLGHLGWVNSDADINPDPIDPNSGFWQSMSPVQPGDLVEMWTLSGDFIDAVSVTENNYDAATGSGFIVWDGRNFDNVQVAPLGVFFRTINGANAQNFTMNQGNNAIKPIPNSAGFWFDDTLRFKLDNSFAYVTLELLDSAGTLFSRPVWNKMMGSSPTVVRAVDLSLVPNGQYTAKFTAWRSDGGLSNPYSIQFIQYRCGDVNNDGSFNVADLTHLISNIFNGTPIDDPIERADADGSGSVNISDVNYLIARIFSGGPPPVCSGVQQ